MTFDHAKCVQVASIVTTAFMALREEGSPWTEMPGNLVRPPSLSYRCRSFDHPLFLITYPYITHCTGAWRAKGSYSVGSVSPLSLSVALPPFNHKPNHAVLPI